MEKTHEKLHTHTNGVLHSKIALTLLKVLFEPLIFDEAFKYVSGTKFWG
jgi:hypothetical protein